MGAGASEAQPPAKKVTYMEIQPPTPRNLLAVDMSQIFKRFAIRLFLHVLNTRSTSRVILKCSQQMRHFHQASPDSQIHRDAAPLQLGAGTAVQNCHLASVPTLFTAIIARDVSPSPKFTARRPTVVQAHSLLIP